MLWHPKECFRSVFTRKAVKYTLSIHSQEKNCMKTWSGHGATQEKQSVPPKKMSRHTTENWTLK